EAAYDAALAALPAGERETAIRLRLERAKARMHVSRLPEAHDELRALADDVLLEPVDPELDADVRRTLAQARFFMTWLMRLEGAPREEWEPEIEAARQGLKALAEEARAAGDAERL